MFDFAHFKPGFHKWCKKQMWKEKSFYVQENGDISKATKGEHYVRIKLSPCFCILFCFHSNISHESSERGGINRNNLIEEKGNFVFLWTISIELMFIPTHFQTGAMSPFHSNPKVPGWTLNDLLLPHFLWTGTLSGWSSRSQHSIGGLKRT